MDIRPLHDRIIVQRLEEDEQDVGRVVIPDSGKEKPLHGKVIAVGERRSKDDGKRLPLDVEAGDMILFGKYSGQEIRIEGEEFLIMREDDVLSIVPTADDQLESTVGQNDKPTLVIKNMLRETLQTRLGALRNRLGSRSWILDFSVTTPLLVAASVPAASIQELASLSSSAAVLNVSLFVPEDLDLSSVAFMACYSSGAIRGLSASVHRKNSDVLLEVEDLLALLDPDDPRDFTFPTRIDSEVLVIGVSQGLTGGLQRAGTDASAFLNSALNAQAAGA